MRSILKLVLVFGAIILMSAFLAPILYDFLPFKFERIFNRLVMVLTLVAVVCFVQIKRETFTQYGLAWKADSASLWIKSFTLSVIVVTLLVMLKIGVKEASWQPVSISFSGWMIRFWKIVGAALLIAFIEEFFFRGFIFAKLKQFFRGRVTISIIVTSVFYSILHFVGHEKPFIGHDPNFLDSLKLVTAPFMSLGAWPSYWQGAVGLFLLGVVLNGLWVQTGSLYPSIGVHAGCVFFVKMDGTYVDFLNNKTLLWGSSLVYDGIVGWIFIVLMGVLLSFVLRGNSGKIQNESR